MADTPKHSVSVAGIVVDDHECVLVIQRRDNAHWEPPGGVLELEETPEEGVKREVLEETGVSVKVIGLSGVYKNMTKSVVALVFRCSAIDETVAETSEASQVRWIPFREIDLYMDPAYAIRVQDAMREGVKVRANDGVNLIDPESD